MIKDVSFSITLLYFLFTLASDMDLWRWHTVDGEQSAV